MGDQKEFKNRLKPQKMNILLDVFRFKLSADQKGIMIFLGWVKSQKVFFLDKRYYGNEGFSLDMNAFLFVLLMTSKTSYGDV